MVIDDNCRKFHIKDLSKNWLLRLFRITVYSGYGGFPLPFEHLLTMLLHTIACVAIYVCLGSNIISFVTAILFAVNPSNTQVSIWMNGKRYAIMTTFLLLMWHYGLWFYPLALVWYAPGAIIAPMLYLMSPYKHCLWLIIPLAIVFHRVIINRIADRWEMIPPGEIKTIRPRKLVILVKMIGYIFCHCLLPRRLSFYHMFMERFGFSDEDNKYWYSFNKDFWVGLVVILVVIPAIILNWGNSVGFGLFWWLIFILPWCQFPIGVTQAVSERVYYLPTVGLMYALANVLLRIPCSDYIIVSMLVSMFTYYLIRLWFYMPAYANLDEFYRYALHEFPEQFRARSHVIKLDLGQAKVFYCLHNCGIGIRYHPKDFTLNLLMCQSLMMLGAFDKAQEYLDNAQQYSIPGHKIQTDEVIASTQNVITSMIKKQAENNMGSQLKPTDVIELKPSGLVIGE